MADTTRREFMGLGTSVAALAALGVEAVQADTTSAVAPLGQGAAASLPSLPPAFAREHVAPPLPFAATALKGISEKLIRSHYENNYLGALKTLHAVRARLGGMLADREMPAWAYNDLKREALMRHGSVVLHELYFANLGGNGQADAAMRSRIAADFGSFDAWENEFRRMGLGLGGGSGWVLFGFDALHGGLENHWLGDHAHGPVGVIPLLVMDMYEHAYQMDYGAAAAKYVDAFMANVRWEAVAQRLANAGKYSPMLV